MLCSSLSFSGLGDMDTEPDDRVDERLFTSEVESREPGTGLRATPSPFSSSAPMLTMEEGIAELSNVLSDMFTGREYGLYRSRGRTAFRKGCRCTEEEAAAAAAEEAAAAAAM